jgi:hypothetical protein
MTDARRLLQHFLGALAYRTQRALRDAPDSFADFRIAPTARTPFELVWQMTGVIVTRAPCCTVAISSRRIRRGHRAGAETARSS